MEAGIKTLQIALATAFCIGGTCTPLHGSIDREKLIASVERLQTKQKQLNDEIEQLKQLLGISNDLETLPLIEMYEELSEKAKEYTKQGIEDFKEERFTEAKEDFQLAWELEPEHYITNYHLGLVYQRVGNVALAKKMLKGAIEAKKDMPHAKKVEEYLGHSSESKDESDVESKEELALRTELINMKKEASSYAKSQVLPFPKRMSESVRILEGMLEKAKDHKKLVQEYYPDIGEAFEAFEWYGKAIEVMHAYESSMKGKELPDGHHGRLLRIEEKAKNQQARLKGYRGNKPERDIRRQLNRDLEELKVFAAQMDQFVKELNTNDEDFTKLCERLREFRWGKRANRHVIVINRFGELLYSSLPGTLEVDRYQDVEGKQFFKDVTFLADELQLKQAEFAPLQLRANGQTVPYVMLYTYVPSHKAFIIVRMPKEDLL